MAKKDQTMDVQKQEEAPADEMERTRSHRSFVPKADIYETEKDIIVLTDIPGANEKTVDVTLEKNVLSINAYIEPSIPSGFDIAYAEYEEGDYQRSFRLSNEIDRDKIEAIVSDGVLRLRLPKSQEAATKKIAVKTK
jgi:HSP20 family protein